MVFKSGSKEIWCSDDASIEVYRKAIAYRIKSDGSNACIKDIFQKYIGRVLLADRAAFEHGEPHLHEEDEAHWDDEP